jgi:hypothetical protein
MTFITLDNPSGKAGEAALLRLTCNARSKMTNHRYEQLVDLIPYGLAHAALRVLGFHTGRADAVGRFELLEALVKMGFDANERQLRRCIHDLRRKGHLICSAPGEDGGYYLAADLAEFREFCERELHPKAIDLLETESAMKESARQKFGEAVQARML